MQEVVLALSGRKYAQPPPVSLNHHAPEYLALLQSFEILLEN